MRGTCVAMWVDPTWTPPSPQVASTCAAVAELITSEGWEVLPSAQLGRQCDLVVGVSDTGTTFTYMPAADFTADPAALVVPAALPAGWEDELRRYLHLSTIDPAADELDAGPRWDEGPPSADVSPAIDAVPSRGHATDPGPDRPVHAFISYSRHDQRYVDELVERCRQEGVAAWIDKRIDYGSRWTEVVRDAIDACGAVVVVMTPEAESSEWVGREISRAEDRDKVIFPLLLRGTRFFTLGDLQYEDVSAGAMPSSRWFAQVRAQL